MEEKKTNYFYSELPVYKDGLISHLSNPDRFEKVPEDWHVIVTDIKGSTQAILTGLHQQVNLVATATIISALNIANSKKIKFPFFFGGDGATLIVPDSIIDEVMDALSVHQENVNTNLFLDLRVDELPVSTLYKEGAELNISKTRLSDRFTIPVVLGDGLLLADDLIKARRFSLKGEVSNKEALNLEGMECRWDAVKPSEETKQIICLIIKIAKTENQADIFKQIFKEIERIYGSYEDRRPISVKGLKLVASLKRFETENTLKYQESTLKRTFKSIVGYIFGKVYLKRESGKDYLKSLVELSDTLVLNGMLNTVISGFDSQRIQLEEALKKLENERKLIYGISVCRQSIMSCYVQDRVDNHIHFIDGSEGGYTKAALVLKQKIARETSLPS
tara:strand:- start:36983 stop:38155 length:1173 start_codon:yes stop_codon:yes gene_type:complete